MSIKLTAVDIDGTLVNSQKEIPEVLSAIQDAKEAENKAWLQLAAHRRCCQTSRRQKLRDEVTMLDLLNGALVQETATSHEIISESWLMII